MDDRGNQTVVDSPLETQHTATYAVTDQQITHSDQLEFIRDGNDEGGQPSPPATIAYRKISSVTIDGGPSGNIFDVQSTAVRTPVTINTGVPIAGDPFNSGNDAINVGSAGEILAGILGAVTLTGKGGTVPLIVNDQALGHCQLQRFQRRRHAHGAAAITYGFMTSLVLNTAAGPNTVDVQTTDSKTPVTVNTGDGPSTVNVGTPDNKLRGIANLTVSGGMLRDAFGNPVAGSATTLNLDDQANTVARGFSWLFGPTSIQTQPTYTVADRSVVRADALTTTFLRTGAVSNTTVVATINYSNLAGLTINGGTTPNVFNVQSTAAGTPTTINVGTAADVVDVGSPGNTLDNLLGALAISGQKNTVVNVNDQGTTSDRTFNLTSTDLTWGADPASDTGAAMAYRGVARLVINGGNGNNVFGVVGTPTNTAVTIYGGTANSDQLVVDNNASLDAVRGALTFHGQTAYSFAVFNDLLNAAVQTYTLSGTKLQRTRMADIAFDGLDQVVLYTGTAKDTVNVLSTLATTPVSVITGGGDDTINVSPKDQNLDNIAGSIAFAAVAGSDTVYLDDQGTTSTASYVTTASSVSRTGMAAVTFASNVKVFINTKGGQLPG